MGWDVRAPPCVARMSKAEHWEGGGDNTEDRQVVGAGSRWVMCGAVWCGVVWPFGRSAKRRPPTLLVRPPFIFLTRELLGRKANALGKIAPTFIETFSS